MPSRAEARVWVERGLRAAVVAALAALLWQSLHSRSGASPRDVNTNSAGTIPLRVWSASPEPPAAIHLEMSAAPAKADRAWLRALAGAGSEVGWSGDIPPMMVQAEPIASPAGGTNLKVAAPDGSPAILSDEIGVIDTMRVLNRGASISAPSAGGSFTARVKASTATTSPMDSLILRRVLVIGTAGWESKFVVAALEEKGWKVDAFIRTAPEVEVVQGAIIPIDTSRYSAVVALDAAASPYANSIVQFARTGGGVILEPGAAALDALSPLRAGTASRALAGNATLALSESIDLASLPLAPLGPLRENAIPIEMRGQKIAVAARRIDAGRALELGYEETWQWRMAGGERSVREHSAWWTRLVSSVAYAPAVAPAGKHPGDEAPLAALVAAIGPRASALTPINSSGAAPDAGMLLFALVALALVAEVTSRRTRGVA